MVQLEQTESGIAISVKAQPAARRNGIVGTHAGMLKVAVTQAPDKGKANEAVADVLADQLELHRNQLHLVPGATSRQKRFVVTGVSLDELRQRIELLLGE